MATVKCQTCERVKETDRPVPWTCGECGHKQAVQIRQRLARHFTVAWQFARWDD